MKQVAFVLTLLLAASGPLAAQRRPPAPRSDTAPAPLAIPAPAVKPASEGVFTDSAKVAHKWQVNPQHALIWDGAPYLPVGGAFTPRSWESADEVAWQQDVAALTTLKSHDLLDILLWPTRALPDIPRAAFQRLIDYLDTNGFHYGLEFGPGLTVPLTGTVVKPSAYRAAITGDNLTASWQVPDADTGAFILVNVDHENDIEKKFSGKVTFSGGVVSQPVDPSLTTGKIIALLYPHRAIAVKGDGTLPDLWRGFDDYRDQLIGALSQIKFGAGLRFFLDPLTRHIGMQEECDYLVPDAPNFLLEWEGFLERKYPNPDEIKFSWGLNEGDFKTHRELARLIPLWANGRGAPDFYDPQSNLPYRILDAGQSHWWQDFLEFRNESILYYLNAMADVVKKQIANVPVVVTWTQTHSMFCNTDAERGYDGIGIMAQAHGSVLVSRTVGPAYSEAAQSARSLWCVATELTGQETNRQNANIEPPRRQERQEKTENKQATASNFDSAAALVSNASQQSKIENQKSKIAGEGEKLAFGYPSEDVLKFDLDWLGRVGVKGFFAGGVSAGGESDWMRAPDSVTWLRHYAATVRPASAQAAPTVLFFPQNTPGPAHIGAVPGAPSVMWLPSFAPGAALDWWPTLRGYTIQTGDNNASIEAVLVSLSGKRLIHFLVLGGDARAIRAFTPDRTPVKMTIESKKELSLTLEETPTVLVTGGAQLIPQEAAGDVIVQLAGLLQQATQQRIPEAQTQSFNLDRAKFSYKTKDYDTAYLAARDALDKLIVAARPYIWLEGEDALVHTFSETAPNGEASSGAYLRLSTPTPPGRAGYGARYLFNVPTDGRYNIWLAGSIPGPEVSPIQWRINSDPTQSPASATAQGLYLDGQFGWTLLGTAELKQGENQSLTVYVTDRAPATGNYSFAIDSLLLIRQKFTPNGTLRPLPFDPATLPPLDKEKPRSKGGQSH